MENSPYLDRVGTVSEAVDLIGQYENTAALAVCQ